MAKKSDKKLDKKSTEEAKKPTVEEYLYSLDMANKQFDHSLERVRENLDITTKVLAEEISLMRNEMSRLNETIYEDRRVLADFVAKFFKDTKTVLNPALAIDGGKKAKAK
jgi:hypothetical protein